MKTLNLDTLAKDAAPIVAGILVGAIALLVLQAVLISFDLVADSIIQSRWSWLITLAFAVVFGALNRLMRGRVDDPERPDGREAMRIAVRNAEDRTAVIDVWKHVVDVQMHFNEMVMRIRNLGLTLVLAAVGAAAVALRDQPDAPGGRGVLATYLIMGGMVGWLAFYALDRWYYHRLLVGAVQEGIFIEKAVAKKIPYLKLATTVTAHSRVRLKSGQEVLKARHKLDFFYLLIALLLALFLRLTAERPPRRVWCPNDSPMLVLSASKLSLSTSARKLTLPATLPSKC